MIVCPTRRALLVQVDGMRDSLGQVICGRARVVSEYRASGDLERVEMRTRRDGDSTTFATEGSRYG
jgi:hypothetical protein